MTLPGVSRASSGSIEASRATSSIAASEASTPTIPSPVANTQVKIKLRSFEQRRAPDGTMSWIIQKTLYEDGTQVLTPAGVQFEEALGLSVLILDDVLPTIQRFDVPVEPKATVAAENNAVEVQPATQASASQTFEDNPETPPEAASNMKPEFRIHLRSLLVDLADLRSNDLTRTLVPRCENGRRRAVVFLRAAQLGRQMALESDEAQRWSKFGRAACVQWNYMPATHTKTQSDSIKNSDQTVFLSQPND